MGGSSDAVCSMAAAPVRDKWVMLSRLGVVVAPPAPECDMMRESRCVSVEVCRC